MKRDAHRMASLEKAIRNTVPPGDMVLDRGAAAGTRSFIALDAGGAHVHAIDPSAIVDPARRLGSPDEAMGPVVKLLGRYGLP